MDEICVRVINLPASIKGVTVRDADGNYNVYINAQLSPDRQSSTLRHEMTHIERGDFDSFDDIFKIEDIDP